MFPQLDQILRDLQAIGPNLLELLRLLRAFAQPATWIMAAIKSLAASMETFLASFLLSTKDVLAPGGAGEFTHSQAIQNVEPYLVVLADVGLGAVVVWGGYHIMWSHSVRNLYSVRNLLPRLLLAVILINFALPLFQAVVDFENLLCRAVTTIPLGFKWTGNLFALGAGTDPGVVPVITLLTLAALYCGYAVLACAYVVRYALLVVLAVTSPLAALLFVMPDTHHYAKEWGSLFASTLFMQPVQLLILGIGFQLENDAVRGNVDPVRHLFALACLFIAFKVPGALHSTSTVGTHAMSSVKHFATVAARHVA